MITIPLNGEARTLDLPAEMPLRWAIRQVAGLTAPVATAVLAAWTELSVAQCGYCQSGQVMAATALLRANPAPTDADIDAALDGNVCRCGAYPRIRAAIHDAAKRLAGGA